MLRCARLLVRPAAGATGQPWDVAGLSWGQGSGPLLARMEADATAAPSTAGMACGRQQARSLHLAPPFLVADDYVPASVTTYRLGRVKDKVDQALRELKDCRACPRDCGVDRLEGKMGACHIGRYAKVATIAPHYGEEACLQGWGGSGTVFFASCNLKCVFCQNWDISHAPKGFELKPQELADWMLKLQEAGCHNINLVTPEHCVPQVVEALDAAWARGLDLPIVYNSSAYDAASSLRMLDGLVDVYMPDFKLWSPASAEKYLKARDYPDRAREAIQEMHRQVGDLCFSPDGLAKRGLLLRHLVMPGLADESRAILDWVARELGTDTFVNIMPQYHPRFLVGKGEQRSRLGFQDYSEIARRPRDEEVDGLIAYARSLGLWRFEEAPRYYEAGASGASAGEGEQLAA